MTRNVAFVLFDGAEELDWIGPLEVFGVTSQIVKDSCKVYTVSETGGQVTCANRVRVVVDYGFADCPKPDIIVIPGGYGTRKEMENPAMLEWLRTASAAAELTTSVCTGALVLASAGLLEGKRATTWFGVRADLANFKDVTPAGPEERWVDEWPVITAQGVSAGIDMALHVVGRLWSPETARRVQQVIEYFPAPPYQDVPIPEVAV